MEIEKKKKLFHNVEGISFKRRKQKRRWENVIESVNKLKNTVLQKLHLPYCYNLILFSILLWKIII